MRHRNIIRLAVIVASLLMIPLLSGASWDGFDYFVAGGLLFGTGLAYELVATKGGTIAYRAGVGLALGTALLLVWMNLAVGVIGSENNPANLMYGGVLAVGLIGAAIARFHARGMARTLFAMASANMLVPVVALIVWTPQFSSGVLGVLVLNAIFVALWVGSALLFRRSAQTVHPV